MRTLPLVCDRQVEPVRHGRRDPHGSAARRHLPTHARGQDIYAAIGLGTFAPPYGTVPEASLVKIDDDIPLTRACLLGCGVTTGWGFGGQHRDVAPGDTVVVIGCGGIGSGAIQGARLAGAEKIVVIDIVESKRDKAFLFGATHFATSIAEGTELVRELTKGVMADSALLTVGLVEGQMINDALELVSKGGAWCSPRWRR